MKILLACMRYSYGDPKRGESYEYVNFHDSLVRLGHDVRLFDFMVETAASGKAGMNRRLLAEAESFRPDLAMFSLYTDEFEPEAVAKLRRSVKTLCFFHDDSWRVDYSLFWARQFDWFTTWDFAGPEKYRRLGLPNALHFPFGCNHALYRRLDVPKSRDVSFVGEWHPWRGWMIDRLRRAGVDAAGFGHRWPGGSLTLEAMVKTFNESRINLNMSNSASWDARYLLSSPRAFANRLRSKKTGEQIKGRHFEICGTGGFQLTQYVEGLERCYAIGDEIGIYVDPDDLVAKVRFYLKEADLRERVAAAGYARVLRDHTFAARFETAFRAMGLPAV
jgi:spore maturation protein CgeB